MVESCKLQSPLPVNLFWLGDGILPLVVRLNHSMTIFLSRVVGSERTFPLGSKGLQVFAFEASRSQEALGCSSPRNWGSKNSVA